MNTESLKEFIFENGTYKLVALFITLSLWVFIFERQVSTISKSVQLEFELAPQHVLKSTTAKKVQFRVRGPRMGLKRFLDGPSNIKIDLNSFSAGRNVVRIYEDSLPTPPGVYVVSVSPTNIYVDLGSQLENQGMKAPSNNEPKQR